MKSPLAKLKGFKLHGKGSDARDKTDFSKPPPHVDDLAQASQDMQDMRDCYDSLLSAAAATANSAYEFAESLRELGSCLMEKTEFYNNAESGSIMMKLAKVQFELQSLVDSYRSHILSTITNPSESLLNELRNVEEMKRQCDEKRSVYEYMVAQQKEKGRSKSGKGDQFSLQQLQAAHDEYGEDATLCVFRLKSLKQGQSRSFLTQAARHHAAQLNFFRKGLRSLEAVEPHVRHIAELQHIDYQFCGLEDDGGEYDHDDNDSGDDINEDRELSFDYGISKQGPRVSASRNSMEVDEDDITFPHASTTASTELNVSSRERRASSYSAPIFLERKSEGSEKLKQMNQPLSKKSNAYVLPTPNDARGAVSSRTSTSGSNTRAADLGGRSHNLWHSSPLEQKKHDKDYGDDHIIESTGQKVLPAQREKTTSSMQLPPPLVEGITVSQLHGYNSSDSRKMKRRSYSGPLISKPSTNSASGPIFRAPASHTLSPPKVSPTSSPPLVSSPRISELHELPRPPPANLALRRSKAPPLVGHSAPLVRGSEDAGNNKFPSSGSKFASPLPVPPLVVSRSFSIPASGQRAMAVHVSKLTESPKLRSNTGEAASPPLTPISLANVQQTSALASQSRQIRGNSIYHEGVSKVCNRIFSSESDSVDAGGS